MAFTRMEIRHDIENQMLNDAAWDGREQWRNDGWIEEEWDEDILDDYLDIDDGSAEEDYFDDFLVEEVFANE